MDKVVEIAQSYLGQKEKPGNSGFIDPLFEDKMLAIGWSKGEAWCAYFVKLVYIEAYTGNEEALKIINENITPSATETYRRFKALGMTSNTPLPGSLAVWQRGKSWKGHIGIVSKIDGDTFCAIEGNTNEKGSREGDTVAEQKRELDFSVSPRSLYLLGFINLNI